MKMDFKGYAAVRIIRSALGHARAIGARDQSDAYGGDGVIVLTCERPEATITVRGFVVLLVAFLALKGVLIAHLGADAYNTAVLNLQNGAWPEQAGAFIMFPDPLSQAVATRLSPIF